MDGVHDLGGMQGFGPVEVEPDEPIFHDEWEARMFAVAGGALGAGGFNSPMFRHAIERMDPGHYLTSSYFEHWLTAVATLLVEEGMISRDDLDARVSPFPLSRPPTVDADDVDAVSPRGSRASRPATPCVSATLTPAVTPGAPDTCAVAAVSSPHRRGGADPRGGGAPPRTRAEQTYGVRFDATELWSDAAEANAPVYVDLYEQYLEPA